MDAAATASNGGGGSGSRGAPAGEEDGGDDVASPSGSSSDEGAAATAAGGERGAPARHRLRGGSATALVAAVVAALRALLIGLLTPITTLLMALPQAVSKAVVAALDEREKKAREVTGLARLKGDTWGELADNNGLIVRRGDTDEETQLVCRVCAAHGSHLHTDVGMFNATQRFADLRRAVYRHVSRPTHMKCAATAAQLKADEKRQQATGMAIGRAAYYLINEAASYYAYERLLLLLSLCGVNVGTLNHSRKFAADLVPAFHSAMGARLQKWLDEDVAVLGGRKRPFAFNADKSTELRRTGQILGMIVMADGELRSVMLADAIVLPGDGTASGLAEVIEKGITKFVSREELQQRIAGFSFDGQYLCEGVQGELCKLLALSLSWHLVQWDAAHLIELVLNDVRLDKIGTETMFSVEWYGPLSELIAHLINPFQYGKAYEEIRAIASALLQRLRDPAKYCETRFAASEKKVIESLLENFLVYRTYYVSASSIPEGATKGKAKTPRTERNAEERAKLVLLNKLTDMMFVGRLLILNDVFQHIRCVWWGGGSGPLLLPFSSPLTSPALYFNMNMVYY